MLRHIARSIKRLSAAAESPRCHRSWRRDSNLGRSDFDALHEDHVQTISWDDFNKVELRIGRILSAQPLPQARKPAYVLQVDFGAELGIKKSSAQITALYSPEQLVGRLVVAVVNFPRKQIGSIQSECLVTGFHSERGEVVLCVPDREVPLGSKLL